jgi:putative membrane protein
MTTEPPASTGAGARLSDATELAKTRTMMAAERTLMAWVRTALSMISFGFGIYKFLHGLQEATTIHLRHPEGPRDIGLFLTALGTASLIAGTVQYAQQVKAVRLIGGARPRLGVAFYVAGAVMLLGLVVFIGLVTRMGPF